MYMNIKIFMSCRRNIQGEGESIGVSSLKILYGAYKEDLCNVSVLLHQANWIIHCTWYDKLRCFRSVAKIKNWEHRRRHWFNPVFSEEIFHRGGAPKSLPSDEGMILLIMLKQSKGNENFAYSRIKQSIIRSFMKEIESFPRFLILNVRWIYSSYLYLHEKGNFRGTQNESRTFLGELGDASELISNHSKSSLPSIIKELQ